MEGPVRALGLQLNVVKASSESELATAFAAIANSGVGGLIIANDSPFIGHREQIVALALRHAVAANFAECESVLAGGLMSYAASFTDAFRQVGVYVGRILKGAKPAELPVVQ
jgi:putative tryptophan/tyrosine transport system substrate-binding protein